MDTEIVKNDITIEVEKVEYTIDVEQAGLRGVAGAGVATGGLTGQILAKSSEADYDTEWVDQSGNDMIPVQSDWEQTNTESLDYIKNKPTIPTTTDEILPTETNLYVPTLPNDANLFLNGNKEWKAASVGSGGVSLIVENSTLLPSTATEGDLAFVKEEGIVQPDPIPTFLTGSSNKYHNLYFNPEMIMPTVSTMADIFDSVGSPLLQFGANTVEDNGYSIIGIAMPLNEETNIQIVYTYSDVEQILDGLTYYAGWTKGTINYTTNEQVNEQADYADIPTLSEDWYIDDTSVVALAELGKYFNTTPYYVTNADAGLYIFEDGEWKAISSGGTGSGTVTSVNDVDPDGTGNIELTSDNIVEGTTNYYVTSTEKSNLATMFAVQELTEAQYNALETPDPTTMYIVDCPIHPTYVELSSSTETIDMEETLQLTATVYPINAEDKTVAWSSSDELVATTDQDGLVTGIGEGTADITVTTNDGGLTDTCVFTVLSNLPQLWQGARTPFSISGNRVTVNATSVSTTTFGYSDNTTGLSQPSGTWITLNAGDKLKYRAKYVSGTKSTPTNTSNFVLNVHPYALGGTKLAWSSMPTNAGEYIEAEYTAPAGDPTIVSGLYGGTYATSTFTNYVFDIELFYKAAGTQDYVQWI